MEFYVKSTYRLLKPLIRKASRPVTWISVLRQTTILLSGRSSVNTAV